MQRSSLGCTTNSNTNIDESVKNSDMHMSGNCTHDELTTESDLKVPRKKVKAGSNDTNMDF